jgi:hypothetical protein
MRRFGEAHNETEGLHANRLGRAGRSALSRAAGEERARAIEHHVPGALLRPLLGRPSVPDVELEPGLDALRDHLREDVGHPRALTGQAFASWSV